MIKTILRAIPLLLGINLAAANENTCGHQAATAEIQQAFDSLVKAARAVDQQAYFAHFDSERFTGLNVDGTVWHSLAELEPLIRTGFDLTKQVKALDFSRVKITLLDCQTGILVNEYRQDTEVHSGERFVSAGGGVQVWSKRSGRWLLVSVAGSSKAAHNPAPD